MVGRSGGDAGCCDRLGCIVIHLVRVIPAAVQEGIVIIIHVRGIRRGFCGCCMGVLREEKLVIFLLGSVGKFLDRTSSGASGEDSIYLSLCGLEGHPFVIVRDHVVIVVNSKLISVSIKYYLWGVIVAIVFFVTRTVCVGIIIIIVIVVVDITILIVVIIASRVEGV